MNFIALHPWRRLGASSTETLFAIEPPWRANIHSMTNSGMHLSPTSERSIHREAMCSKLGRLCELLPSLGECSDRPCAGTLFDHLIGSTVRRQV
jgi:hypothetical protein